MNITAIVLDLLLVAAVIYYFGHGWRKGFLSTLVHVVGYVLACCGAYIGIRALAETTYQLFIRQKLVQSVSDALRDYESKLVSDGVTTISNLSGETKAVEGVILRIASEYSDGRTIYKFLLESPQDILFTAQASVSPELALTQPGDRVSASYLLSSNGIADADSFDNLEFTQQAS